MIQHLDFVDLCLKKTENYDIKFSDVRVFSKKYEGKL